MFAAVRHPDIEALGVIPIGALEAHRLRGWYRVSEWVDQPSDLHLPDFEDAHDLDAEPEPEPKPKPKRKSKSEIAEEDSSPVEPADDDEEQEA